jgi:hypothetical protein
MWRRASGRLVPLILAISLTAAACSNSDSDSTRPDPAAAETCEELADIFVDLTQGMLDALGALSQDELDDDFVPTAEMEEASDAFVDFIRFAPRDLPDCGSQEIDRLVCARRSQLTPRGTAGERLLQDNFPPCDGN